MCFLCKKNLSCRLSNGKPETYFTQRQGRVSCSFVVDTDGSLKNIEVIRGIDPSLDREAVRVIREMPKWNPGVQNNMAVAVKYTVPVTFRLQ